jgi:cystathionine beta-lyase/cystathionine gamma-synthase
MKRKATWSSQTRLHHPQRPVISSDNPPLIAPIYQSVKFVVNPDIPYSDQFIYSRLSNPTVRQLELSLAEIQQKEDCLVFASGIAAISGTMLGLLKSGDHVITFRELYKPARMLIRDVLPKFGIESTILKLADLDSLESSIIRGKTKLIHFESPTNPNLEIADIQKIINIAHKHNVLVSMDGTFAGLHQHTQFDIDVMIQSLTKFANGHGDVLAGSVAGKKSVIQKIRQMSITLGATLDPHAAFLVERGLKTYQLRVERHTQNAATVAAFLASHPAVEKVFYPGLSTHPQHELAKTQMVDMGAVVSFVLKNKEAEAFCQQLEMIQFAVSLGSTESIICPTHFFFGDDLTQEEKAEMGIGTRSLRLSVGLESAEDIIADLKAALEA